MSNERALQGVLPVFQTPYREDESIDFETLEREIHWLFDHRAQGVVMAMVSEVLRLSSEERGEVAERVCRFSEGRGPVVISVGAESLHTALRYARHAESVGAAAVMAIPPVSIGVDEKELASYYRGLIDAIGIPMIIQDASAYVGRPMSIGLQANLLDQYGPERVMFKPEAAPIGPRLSELRDATGGAAPIFEGSGGIALVDSYRRGVVGTMPGAELIEAIVALWQALESGDEQRVYALSLPISSLVAMQSGLDGFLAVEKHLLMKQGVLKNTIVRGPVGFHLDGETLAEVDRLDALVRAAL